MIWLGSMVPENYGEEKRQERNQRPALHGFYKNDAGKQGLAIQPL
jgi:hypothetical protein